MANVPDVIRRARAYAEANNRSISTVSRLLFGNGNRIEEIERGSSSVRVDILQRALPAAGLGWVRTGSQPVAQSAAAAPGSRLADQGWQTLVAER